MRPSALLVLATLWSSCNQPVADDAGTDAGQPTTDAGTPTPLKVLFLFENSQSLTITDPNAERATALTSLLENTPSNVDLSIAVTVFQGTTRSVLTGQGLPAFIPVSNITASERATLAARLLSFTAPGSDAGTNVTDWVRPLSDAYVLLSNDSSNVANAGLPRAKYAVVFVSDGHPTVNQDSELLCGDAVARIRALQVCAKDVVVNTAHVFKPTQPATCGGDAGLSTSSTCAVPTASNPGACPSAAVDLDAERLRRMAVLGGGAFRDFHAGTAIDFAALVP